MTNYGKMVCLRDNLTGFGHEVFIPEPALCRHLEQINKGNYIDTCTLKIKYDFIRGHCGNIIKSDCILVANYDKNGIKNYVGGNTFLEMGFAFVMGRKIYLVNPIPDVEFYYQEIKAMKPIILKGKLSVFSKV
jgi:hypothetical protein